MTQEELESLKAKSFYHREGSFEDLTLNANVPKPLDIGEAETFVVLVIRKKEIAK